MVAGAAIVSLREPREDVIVGGTAGPNRLPPGVGDTPIAACAAGRAFVYFAPATGGVRAIRREAEPRRAGQQADEGTFAREATGYARIFVSLFALGNRLYAVAGDENAYRFSWRGEPDRRMD